MRTTRLECNDYPGGVVIVHPKPTPTAAEVAMTFDLVGSVDVVAVARYLAIGT